MCTPDYTYNFRLAFQRGYQHGYQQGYCWGSQQTGAVPSERVHPVILFDLDGTLLTRSRTGMSARPGLYHIHRLQVHLPANHRAVHPNTELCIHQSRKPPPYVQERFRVGVYSYASQRNTHDMVKFIRHTTSRPHGCSQLFDEALIFWLDKGNDCASRKKALEPLHVGGLDSVLLVDHSLREVRARRARQPQTQKIAAADSCVKAVAGERENVVVVPPFTGADRYDDIIRKLVEALLSALDDKCVDVRAKVAQIESELL